ncbi:type II toxin-antitoxin system VapC family toxin [Glycomyces buryatensis]|uniref:Ribonuclease VapC n=1 Tax=Glycomyces buryatensis TaxID=2570927 RepID=A0A4S8Q670_9ACTN|nr:type II toxin-antitoxin system VapC family toxin [Glycomyces buryatensis]THV39783.1 type II toxin-antitoxin system VapC family toxin [Glycomyces buryatensis]
MIRWTYIDTSAAVKLFRTEPHSDPFDRWLDEHAESRPITSDLTRTELRRALHAAGSDERTWRSAESWIDHTALIRLTPDLCNAAGRLGTGTTLRSLDAIHVAAALQLQAFLDAFVTYDKRLADTAAACDLPVACPGADC